MLAVARSPDDRRRGQETLRKKVDEFFPDKLITNEAIAKLNRQKNCSQKFLKFVFKKKK